MKKILIALTIAISCLGISKVNAETLYLTDTTEQNFSQYKTILGNDNFNTIINDLLDEYKNNYMSDYPYFYINVIFSGSYDSFRLNINLNCENNIPEVYWTWAVSKSVVLTRFKDSDLSIKRSYNVMDNNNFIFDLNQYSQSIDDGSSSGWEVNPITIYSDDYTGPYDNAGAYYTPFNYYLSNFDLYLPSFPTEYQSYSYIKNYDSFGIPTFDSQTNYRIITFDKEDYLIEPYYLYDSDVDVSIPNIEEINLNDYAYVALALKDYNKKAFETIIQVKGQYCLTPVYNYGMTERKDILEGTQVDRCSPYYDNYTPIRTYILENDLKNNAIYYLKSYDTTKDNYIKIDTSVFDVTYVTEENKDNPYVSIGGKTYPTIPYDNLTDTATKSEDEGYVSGAVEEFSFADIFTAPMEFLEDIWDSIVSVFSLVNDFISLLPPVMQNFIYASFLLGMSLGLIKLIF